MTNPALVRRDLAALGLALAAGLSLAFGLPQPDMPADHAGRLSAVAEAGGPAVFSMYAFALLQLALLPALLGLAHLMRGRAPVLSLLTAVLGVLGVFGHTMHAGTTMVYLAMADDPGNRAVHATTWESVESSPAMFFSLVGLIGFALGTVLLAVGLRRGKVGPAWAPYTLVAFVLLEFLGGAISPWAMPLAGLLFSGTFLGLAVAVWRTSEQDWRSGVDAVPEGAGSDGRSLGGQSQLAPPVAQ